MYINVRWRTLNEEEWVRLCSVVPNDRTGQAMGKNLKLGNSQHKKTLGLLGLRRALPTTLFCNSVITVAQSAVVQTMTRGWDIPVSLCITFLLVTGNPTTPSIKRSQFVWCGPVEIVIWFHGKMIVRNKIELQDLLKFFSSVSMIASSLRGF